MVISKWCCALPVYAQALTRARDMRYMMDQPSLRHYAVMLHAGSAVRCVTNSGSI
jgi:hypothetical protein